MDILSYTLGKKAGGGGSTPVLQDKEVTITQNGESTVTKDSGYDGLNTVSITTNVPQPSGKITITENGTDIDVSSYASADVTVPTGVDINDYFKTVDDTVQPSYGESYVWARIIKKIGDTIQSFPSSSNAYFQNYGGEEIVISKNIDTSNITNMSLMFKNCYNLKRLDLSSFDTSNVTNVNNLFDMCLALTFLDIRTFEFSKMSNNTNNIFGQMEWTGVPANCEIIVKNATEKTWVTTNYYWLTNVKTVAEYEG